MVRRGNGMLLPRYAYLTIGAILVHLVDVRRWDILGFFARALFAHFEICIAFRY